MESLESTEPKKTPRMVERLTVLLTEEEKREYYKMCDYKHILPSSHLRDIINKELLDFELELQEARI